MTSMFDESKYLDQELDVDEKTFVSEVMVGIDNDAPIVRSLAMLKKLVDRPGLPPSKKAVDVVLDSIVDTLTSSKNVWAPSLDSEKKGVTRLDSDVRAWLANEVSYSPTVSKRSFSFSKSSTDSAIPMMEKTSSSDSKTEEKSLKQDHISGPLTELNASKYRKKIEVHAFRAGANVQVKKSWGVSSCGSNDWIIVSQSTDIYTCADEVFKNSYESVPGRPNVYRKTEVILATKKKTAFHFEESGANGSAGDYIAQGANGEQWAVPKDVFESTYEKLPDLQKSSTSSSGGDLMVSLTEEYVSLIVFFSSFVFLLYFSSILCSSLFVFSPHYSSLVPL